MSQTNRMVLLGAGASVEAGVPAAVKLTETLINSFSLQSRTGQVLRYVYGGLMLGMGSRGEDPLQGINIEDLVEAIDQLANRKNLQIAPFIDLWNEGVSRFQEQDAREALLTAFQRIQEMVNAPLRETERAMRRLDLDYALQNVTEQHTRDFLFARENVIKELIEVLWLDEKADVSYLHPLIRQGNAGPFTIATLNYDNTVELACDALQVPCTTGLQSWNRFEGFSLPDAGIDLLKLHGSITWEKIVKRYVRSKEMPMPHTQIKAQDRAAVHFRYEPAVIFGAGNKLTAEGPFLELLLAFRERLERHEELVVIGYSFGDAHINDAIWRWLNRKQTRALKVIDYHHEQQVVPFKWLFEHLEGRYTYRVDGARAGIKAVF